jgi:hypothetical protein
MTTVRRLLTVLCVAAAVALPAAAAGAQPLDPGVCPAEPANLACGQPGPGANQQPDAVDDQLTVGPGGTVRANVLGNDLDPDGDALRVGEGTIRTAAGGQVTFYRDGLFSYRTPAGFVGVDSFQYGLLDSYGAQDVGTVTIRVGV